MLANAEKGTAVSIGIHDEILWLQTMNTNVETAIQ